MENVSRGHCLIYLRVSTDRQAEKGIAIPTQQDACLKYAEDLGYICDLNSDIYIDRGESARKMDRPSLLDMLSRCKTDKSIKAIIVYDISRLARDRIDFALIKRDFNKHGIKLVSVTEAIDDSPAGQMLEGILSSVAEFFSTQGGLKVKANMVKKAKEGVFPGLAPYGYKNVHHKEGAATKSWLEIEPEQARWVTRAFELFTSGNYSSKTLAQKLEIEGFVVRKHKASTGKLHHSYIEKMLRNKIYIGYIIWGGVVNPQGKHELFLDRTLFERAQMILDSRLGGGSRTRRLSSTLKSISFCDECGSRMTPEEHKLKNGEKVQYLRCRKEKYSKKMECHQKYTREKEYEKQFIKLLRTITLPDSFVGKLRIKVKSLFENEQKIYEKARLDILGKIEDVKRKKKNLVIKLVAMENANVGDHELYELVKTDLNAEELRLNEDLHKIESKIAAVVRTVEIALSLVINCHYAYEKARTPDLRALLVRTLFKRLYMRNGAIVRATLNEPLDYLCHKKIKNNTVFDYANSGDPGRALVEYIRSLAQTLTPMQMLNYENCYGQLADAALI